MEGRPPKKCFVQTLSLTVGEWVGVISSNIFIENIQDVYVTYSKRKFFMKNVNKNSILTSGVLNYGSGWVGSAVLDKVQFFWGVPSLC